MRLFLIRHGETVDNVAGLYAGVRDSALTIHGVEQARRLGTYLDRHHAAITHIFASPLSRARKTAEAIQKAQDTPVEDDADGEAAASLEIVLAPDLIEQDFGFYEGKSFFARSDPKKSGRDAHHDKHKDDPGFVDVESKESMAKRADAFLDEHLVHLLREEPPEDNLTVAVVSHGILLSNLWRRLLLRLPRKSLTIAPEVTAARDSLVLEHLGGWSNTGYLELTITKNTAPAVEPPASVPSESEAATAAVEPATSAAPAETATLPTPVPPTVPKEEAGVSIEQPSPTRKVPDSPAGSASRILQGFCTTISAVDSKEHLVGLKRQRGGIGRLAHDEGQKKLDSFFKRQKTS